MAKAEDIARLWVEQADKGPKRAGNFWRRGTEAGHHGTRIAALVESPSGKVALVMNSHWGTGTAMFINLCASLAKKAGYPVFRVKMPWTDEHANNLKFFESHAKDAEAKIATARTVDWQATADAIRAEAARYRATFGL